MQAIAKFEKVSFNQYQKDQENAQQYYNDIKLPKRATIGSAGYDFYMPYDLVLEPGQTAKIPTGIRASMQNGWVLCLFPIRIM